jgi:hypothetical protein
MVQVPKDFVHPDWVREDSDRAQGDNDRHDSRSAVQFAKSRHTITPGPIGTPLRRGSSLATGIRIVLSVTASTTR